MLSKMEVIISLILALSLLVFAGHSTYETWKWSKNMDITATAVSEEIDEAYSKMTAEATPAATPWPSSP